jgi:hypothetical protein
MNKVIRNKKWWIKNMVLIMAQTVDLRTEVYNSVSQDYKF